MNQSDIQIRRKPQAWEMMKTVKPSITTRYVFAWKANEETLALEHHHTTDCHWPSIHVAYIGDLHTHVVVNGVTRHEGIEESKVYTQEERLQGAMNLIYELPQLQTVHVVYEPISRTEATTFTLYLQDADGWQTYEFEPPNYAEFDFEYFVMSSGDVVAECAALMNTNEEIAIALGHGFLNYYEIQSTHK